MRIGVNPGYKAARGGLKIAGDALFSGQMEKNVAEKVASYEDAKAKLKK